MKQITTEQSPVDMPSIFLMCSWLIEAWANEFFFVRLNFQNILTKKDVFRNIQMFFYAYKIAFKFRKASLEF